jgi:signal transduction histidine kinase
MRVEGSVGELVNGAVTLPGGEVLERAAASVAAGWRPGAWTSHGPLEVAAHVNALVEALRDGRLGDRGALSPAVLVLRRRLLDRLRAEFLRHCSACADHPDATEILGLLLAFERVRAQLDPDWGESFATHLVGPDGLALIMEVAHDLRSPLTSILFLSDALRRGQSGVIGDVQRRQLGIIYSAALSLTSMVSDVMELTQGGDHLSDNRPAPFSVRQVLESVRDMVLPMAEIKGLAIRVVPPDDDYRLGFSVALSRVLLNLAANALKFTPRGLVEVAARSVDEDGIEFSVRDAGDGIAPDAVRSLFEVFKWDPTRKALRFSGTGLGLSICRTLVHAMGSELRMETRPDRGTRFYFELRLPAAGP